METKICPLDNLPCERDCPDRYNDRPGCFLTTAQAYGAAILPVGVDSVGLLFMPGETNERQN